MRFLQPFCYGEARRIKTMRKLSSTNLQEWENKFSHYCEFVLLIIGNCDFLSRFTIAERASVLLFFCLKIEK